MTSAARPINRVWYHSNFLKHSKIQSNLPFKMMQLTPILLLFPHCSYKIYSHSLIAVDEHSHYLTVVMRALTFLHCTYETHLHSLTAVTRHTRIPLTAVMKHTHISSSLTHMYSKSNSGLQLNILKREKLVHLCRFMSNRFL